MLDLPMQMLDPELRVPTLVHEGDAGLDLQARINVTLNSAIGPTVVPTGVAVAIPTGYVGLVCPRSGLAAQEGIGVLNAPGVIDSGYRGEVKVVLFSTRTEITELRRGDRIAQLLVLPCAHVSPDLTESLPPTTRGDSGFGSSGR
jgi:dUTP pyrophosphatase